DDRVIRCNAQAYRMFGGAGIELIGSRFASLFASEAEHARQTEAGRAKLAAGELFAYEAQLRGGTDFVPAASAISGEHPGSRTFWALVSLRAVDPRTQASGMIASILDISERRAQEEQL